MKSNRMRNSIIILAAVIIILIAGIFAWANKAARDSLAEQTEAIRDAVYKRALQCYVIEGAYPESLDYLIENYGLAVNREDYKIVYIPFAENLPPEVRVIYRKDS
ncbi:MAG: hypothetical protein E7220_08375 [Clostridiales bacterium]|nr:hypothetical protein [Clostridiales bacterium]